MKLIDRIKEDSTRNEASLRRYLAALVEYYEAAEAYCSEQFETEQIWKEVCNRLEKARAALEKEVDNGER